MAGLQCIQYGVARSTLDDLASAQQPILAEARCERASRLDPLGASSGAGKARCARPLPRHRGLARHRSRTSLVRRVWLRTRARWWCVGVMSKWRARGAPCSRWRPPIRRACTCRGMTWSGVSCSRRPTARSAMERTSAVLDLGACRSPPARRSMGPPAAAGQSRCSGRFRGVLSGGARLPGRRRSRHAAAWRFLRRLDQGQPAARTPEFSCACETPRGAAMASCPRCDPTPTRARRLRA